MEKLSPWPSQPTPPASAGNAQRAGPSADGQPQTSSFAQALAGLSREIDGGGALVQRALHARGDLPVAQLLALQAGIYRYSQALELAAKLVDRGTNAVRTTLQSQ